MRHCAPGYFALTKLAMLAILAGLCACSEELENNTGNSPDLDKQLETPASTSTSMTANNLWGEGAAILNEAAIHAELLNSQVMQLLERPSQETLLLAQQSWSLSAEAIESFHSFSRLGLTSAPGLKTLLDMQFQLAAWPIQPGYLDAFGPHLYSGIVFDISTPLNESSLRAQHGLTDLEDATLGIYTIEFMLFGENGNKDYRLFTPLAKLNDQSIEMGYEKVAELPNNRRRRLLRLQSEILTKDIAKLITLWSDPQPQSISALFMHRSLEQQQIQLTQAVQNTLTEQILKIAEQQKLSEDDANQLSELKDLRLLERVKHQLSGIKRLVAHSPLRLSSDFIAKTEQCIAIEALKAAPIDQPQSRSEHWRTVYSCIRDLIKALSPPANPEQLTLVSTNEPPSQ